MSVWPSPEHTQIEPRQRKPCSNKNVQSGGAIHRDKTLLI